MSTVVASYAGECPVEESGFHTCDHPCRDNNDCTQGDVCCQYGCGSTCVKPVEAEPYPEPGMMCTYAVHVLHLCSPNDSIMYPKHSQN